MKQLTISLDDDLYAMARDHAAALRTSLSEAIADLLRRHPAPQQDKNGDNHNPDGPDFFISPLTGLRVARGRGVVVTNEDVARAEEEECLYHAVAGGFILKNQKPS